MSSVWVGRNQRQPSWIADPPKPVRTWPPDRTCMHCHTRLSRYNSQAWCSACVTVHAPPTPIKEWLT